MKKTQNPAISIVMPVKNAGVFLEICLNSILQQTFRNWELCAVDDHSEDGSRAILEKYAAMDARISVFSNPGKGIIPALQAAFRQSRGNFLHRMDADDIMPPEKLEKLYSVLVKNGPGHLAAGCVDYFREDGELGDGYRRYALWLNEITRKGANFKDIYKECVIPSPCWMIGREDFTRLGAFERDVYPEDYDLCFRFYKAGLKVLGVPAVLHLWRDHSARSSRNDPNYSDNRFLDLKLDYFLELDIDPKKALFLWGAGKKAKLLARMLQAKSVDFRWISNNPKKRNVPIYGIQLEDFPVLANAENVQVLVMVANPEEQAEISLFLRENGLQKAEDFFFFC